MAPTRAGCCAAYGYTERPPEVIIRVVETLLRVQIPPPPLLIPPVLAMKKNASNVVAFLAITSVLAVLFGAILAG
jgi:hypothetical protein